MSKNEKNRLTDQILDWLEVVVGSIFAVVLVFTFLFRIVVVDGNSMNCTLYNSDIILLTHIMYEPKNGDIVVLNSEYLNEIIVKRVIATQGQTVEIDYENNTVSVDGKVLSEYDYIKEKIMFDSEKYNSEFYDEKTKTYKYTVPENSIFVMGDNRNHSTDSRTFGCVDVNTVVGKVFFRLASPYGSIGLI